MARGLLLDFWVQGQCLELSIWAGAELRVGRAALTCCDVGDIWNIKGANVREEVQTTGLQKLILDPSIAEHCVPGLWNVQAVQPAVSKVLALSCPAYRKIRVLRWYLS